MTGPWLLFCAQCSQLRAATPLPGPVHCVPPLIKRGDRGAGEGLPGEATAFIRNKGDSAVFSASGRSLRGTLLPPFGVWRTRAGEGRGGEGELPRPACSQLRGHRPRSRRAAAKVAGEVPLGTRTGPREPPEAARSPRRGRQQRPRSQDPAGERDRRGLARAPPPGPSAGGQSAPPGGGAQAASPAPAPPPVINAAAGSPAACSSGCPGGGTIMPSAMFLAVHHDCGSMDKSSGGSPKSEEKREKMKRTLLKDWKARLSYFLQHSSSPEKPKTGKKSKQQTFIRPSPEEAQLWSEAFDELLASKYGLAAFRAFLKSEFCEENIEFWLACEDFKKTKSPQKLSSKAKKIYTDFIEKEAPKEINIDFQTKTLIAQNIQEATSGCFATAQKRVYSLMENNSYPRFLESAFYQDLCKKPQITAEAHAT